MSEQLILDNLNGIERIAIWGYGYLGKRYYTSLSRNKSKRIAYIVDKNPNVDGPDGINIISPSDLLLKTDYDGILLANMEESIRRKMREFLVDNGVPNAKIIDGGIKYEESNLYDFTCKAGTVQSSLLTLRTIIASRRISVYGIGRRAMDYVYMFGKPYRFVSDECKLMDHLVDVPVIGFQEYMSSMEECDFLVVANSPQNGRIPCLNESVFEHWKNYCFVHEIGKILDLGGEIENVVAIIPNQEKIKDFDQFCRYYGDGLVKEKILLDDNYANVNKLAEDGRQIIIFDREDKSHLYFNGLEERHKNVTFWASSMMLPSVVFEKTELADSIDIPTCLDRTDNYVEITDLNGHFNVAACCPVYFKAAWYGAVGFRSFYEVWHSALARAIRLSVINHTYIACTNECPFIATKEKKYLDDSSFVLSDYSIEAPGYPATVTLNFDESCNLHCSFCRQNLEFSVGEDRSRKDRMAEEIETQLLSKPEVKEIRLSGNGEVFASPSYQKILYDERNRGKDLYIVSNGTLLHKAQFDKIIDLYQQIRVSVSIGAFNKGLYERLWRGANFERTIQNIEDVGALRKRGAIKHLKIYYMCTTESYKDIPAFTAWAEDNGVDEIVLMRIFPKGEIVGEEYERLSLFDARGNMHQEYRDFFDSELFQKKIFAGGNILPKR